jgi:TfoX/Sxy family transcriptional regulator of competence genes
VWGYAARMAYDERLAEEVRERLRVATGGALTEKAMFGGLAFMVDGHLTIGASRTGGLLVRTDPADADEVLALEGVEPMVNAGRKMPGWVFVAADVIRDEGSLDDWIERSLGYVTTLPPK